MSHHQQQQSQRGDNKKISLQAAMEQLSSMFPDLPPEIIKRSLYHTKGYMERTIEILLQTDPPTITSSSTSSSTRQTESEFPDERPVRHTLETHFLRGVLPTQQQQQQHRPRSKQEIMDEKMARDIQRHTELEQNLVMAGLIPETTDERMRWKHATASRGQPASRVGRIGAYPSGRPPEDLQQQSGFSRFSELAKKKLTEFRSRFKRTSPEGGSSAAEYSSLLQTDDYDSDEEWNKRL